MKPLKITLFTVTSIFLILYLTVEINAQQRILEFSGTSWKLSNGIATPSGNNLFKDDSTMQYVDENGWLHLKLKKYHGIWYCSQLQAEESFGYGEYLFYLKTNLDELDERIVLGLLIDKDISEANLPQAAFNTNTLGIQISRWNDPSRSRGWYVIYPLPQGCRWPFDCNNTNAYVENFPIRIPKSNRTTYKLVWNNVPAKLRNVSFQSYIGNSPSLPKQTYLIKEVKFEGENIPTFINEKPTLNLWFFGSNAPVSNMLSEVEVIIKSVTYSPGK